MPLKLDGDKLNMYIVISRTTIGVIGRTDAEVETPVFCSSEVTAAKSLQSCPTLCNPMDGSPPGFPIPGILQARTLEWVAISFSNA